MLAVGPFTLWVEEQRGHQSEAYNQNVERADLERYEPQGGKDNADDDECGGTFGHESLTLLTAAAAYRLALYRSILTRDIYREANEYPSRISPSAHAIPPAENRLWAPKSALFVGWL